eukprot:665980-Amorphochlora_amoeboformis.AAC.1
MLYIVYLVVSTKFWAYGCPHCQDVGVLVLVVVKTWGVLTVKTWGVLTLKTWGVLTAKTWGVLTVKTWGSECVGCLD